MVVDGSEMSRYGLPYFCQSDKTSCEGAYNIGCSSTKLNFVSFWDDPNIGISCLGWKLATRLYGGIIHGRFAGAFMYPAHLSGGSNVTCEVIYR